MDNPIIEIKNVSKNFRLPHERRHTLKEHFVNIFNRRSFETFKALQNVSFEVRKGEFLGIIGRNGSGKSTLLKVIAGILKPNSGKVIVNGSIAPFLELGVGFQPDLSARDNVYLYGAILGLTRKKIDEKFDGIIKFAELENFVDQKLKNFSSGMQVRLAFSTAIQAEADILLLDEVLAVGDLDFQRKCHNEFRRLISEGKTVIFVSHDLLAIEKYCHRVIFLDQSVIKGVGEPEQMIQKYQHSFVEAGQDTTKAEGHKDLYINELTLLDDKGVKRNIFQIGEKIIFRISCQAKKEMKDVIFGVEIFDDNGAYLSGINMKMDNIFIERIEGKKTVDFIIEKNPFLDGIYYVTPAVADKDGILIYDRLEKMFKFKIVSEAKGKYFGSVRFPYAWRY